MTLKSLNQSINTLPSYLEFFSCSESFIFCSFLFFIATHSFLQQWRTTYIWDNNNYTVMWIILKLLINYIHRWDPKRCFLGQSRPGSNGNLHSPELENQPQMQFCVTPRKTLWRVILLCKGYSQCILSFTERMLLGSWVDTYIRRISKNIMVTSTKTMGSNDQTILNIYVLYTRR